MLSALLLTGCSTTGLFVLNSSLKLKSTTTSHKNIDYGSEQEQALDLYIPSNAAEKPLPVLVFFYGGSWDTGNKEMYYFIADAFTKRGYIVVIPDYVKYPDGLFPKFIEDGAAAIAWTQSNIAQYGGDPENIFMAGHSAGAHLGGMLATDGRYMAKHGLTPRSIKAFSGLAGPYNFTPDSPTLIKVFGPEENFPNMQTMNFVDGDEPPMLLLHGAEDDTVGVLNQEVLIEKLNALGNRSSGILYPKLTHIGILMSLTPLLKRDSTTIDDMDQYFKSFLEADQKHES